MSKVLRHIYLIVALCLPGLAAAHPHIFITTGLTPVLDGEGRLAGVEVAWRYDEFYSLLVLEDLELDSDHDGSLSVAEIARLDGFDMQWVEGYEGDLFVYEGTRKLMLGPPETRGSGIENGMIVTRHFRPVMAAGKGPFLIQAYDPTYYSAYDLGLGVSATDGCEVEITPPDISAAEKQLQAELAKLPKDAESNFPEVGAVFAEKVVLRCDAGS